MAKEKRRKKKKKLELVTAVVLVIFVFSGVLLGDYQVNCNNAAHPALPVSQLHCVGRRTYWRDCWGGRETDKSLSQRLKGRFWALGCL